jgi:hypothetical protein
MTGPSGCCDPATRAATLLATPYSLQLSVPGLPSRPCPIGAVVGTALFTLVRPGAVADAVREAPGDATLAAVARSVAGDGSTPVHAGLEVLGTVRRVPQGRRSAAALALHDNLACDDLLDAVVDDRWLLAEIEPFAVTWHLAQASVPLDPVDLAHAQVDEVLRHSTRLCPRPSQAGRPGSSRWTGPGRASACTTAPGTSRGRTGTDRARTWTTCTSRSRTARCPGPARPPVSRRTADPAEQMSRLAGRSETPLALSN